MIARMFKFFRQPAIDPLQVAMTGVRMGERFLLVGCDDALLLAGLGAKVGLSGGAAAVVFDEHQAVLARRAAAREGFLLDSSIYRDGDLPFDDESVDMVVVDDTKGGFANRAPELRAALLKDARRVLRKSGGRVEIVEGLGSTGPFGKATPRPAGYDIAKELETAGYRPVRVLAEVTSFRFVEGLRVG
jgi:ubiquinone/menaquinone biosynthesis C-methylase UbiE